MIRAGIAASFAVSLAWYAAAQPQTQPSAPPPASAAAASPTRLPEPQSKFVGNNVCRTCHPDIWSNFFKNPHYKSIASGKEPPERTGCEGCHGPAGGHVASGGGKTTIPHAFSLME